jgi:hypothetical protein
MSCARCAKNDLCEIHETYGFMESCPLFTLFPKTKVKHGVSGKTGWITACGEDIGDFQKYLGCTELWPNAVTCPDCRTKMAAEGRL